MFLSANSRFRFSLGGKSLNKLYINWDLTSQCKILANLETNIPSLTLQKCFSSKYLLRLQNKTFLQTLFVHCSKNSTSLSFVSSLWLQQGFVTFSLNWHAFSPFLEFNLICILSVLSDYFTFWTIKCVPEDWEDVAKLWQQHSMTKWQNFTQHSKKSLFLNLQLSYKKVSFLHRFYKILFLTQIPTLGVNV